MRGHGTRGDLQVRFIGNDVVPGAGMKGANGDDGVLQRIGSRLTMVCNIITISEPITMGANGRRRFWAGVAPTFPLALAEGAQYTRASSKDASRISGGCS